jgi:hypothetical protein
MQHLFVVTTTNPQINFQNTSENQYEGKYSLLTLVRNPQDTNLSRGLKMGTIYLMGFEDLMVVKMFGLVWFVTLCFVGGYHFLEAVCSSKT